VSDNQGFEAIHDYFMGRVYNYAEFASRRMSRQKAAFYVSDIRFLIANLLESPTANTIGTEAIADFMGEVGAIMRNRPLTCNTIRSTLNGDMSAEVAARKMAIEHVLDLAYSYRRFQGIVPMGASEFHLRNVATTILKSHLESFLPK